MKTILALQQLILNNNMVNTCGICNKEFARGDSLKRHLSMIHGLDDEPTKNEEVKSIGSDDDDDDENMDEEGEDENTEEDGDQNNSEEEDVEEDTSIESTINEVFDEYENVVQEHVQEPESLAEYSKNGTIASFLRDKLINKFAEDFKTVSSWNELDVTRKWSRLAQKRMAIDDVDAMTAMKRVLLRDEIIKEWVEENLSEETDDDDVDDEHENN